jgi:hypothetical protein
MGERGVFWACMPNLSVGMFWILGFGFRVLGLHAEAKRRHVLDGEFKCLGVEEFGGFVDVVMC